MNKKKPPKNQRVYVAGLDDDDLALTVAACATKGGKCKIVPYENICKVYIITGIIFKDEDYVGFIKPGTAKTLIKRKNLGFNLSAKIDDFTISSRWKDKRWLRLIVEY